MDWINWIVLYILFGGLVLCVRAWNIPDNQIFDRMPMLAGTLLVWPLYVVKFTGKLILWLAMFIWYCLISALDDVWHI